MANFYLYRRPAGDLHRLIVWDKDHTFTAIDSSILLRAEENLLFSRALAFGDLRTLYLDVLERCARLAVADGWLDGEIVRLAALIDDAAREDRRKPYDNEVHDMDVEFLRQFVRQRSGVRAPGDCARARATLNACAGITARCSCCALYPCCSC